MFAPELEKLYRSRSVENEYSHSIELRTLSALWAIASELAALRQEISEVRTDLILEEEK